MSAFLSHVHHQLYAKIKYQEELANTLQEVLHAHQSTPYIDKDPRLEDGDLETHIDLNNIHGYLAMQIKTVELRLSHLMDHVSKQQLTEQALLALFQKGKVEFASKQLQDPIQAFQELQQYMLHGMPCDGGVRILSKDENNLCFQCDPLVHDQIHNLVFYAQLLHTWIQGCLSSSNMTILLEDDFIYTIRKEVCTCTQ